MFAGASDSIVHPEQFGDTQLSAGTLAEHGIYQGMTVFGTHHPADRALFFKRFTGELAAHASGAPASASQHLHAAQAITNVAGGLGGEEE